MMSFIKVDMKTARVRSLFLLTAVIFILCSTIIIWELSKINGFTLKEKIEYSTKALTSIGIFFWGIAVSVNAYYTAQIAQGLGQSSFGGFLFNKLTRKKNNEIYINYLEPKQLITERFSRGIEQLGSEQMETRLGAIYTLEKIAKDSPQDHWTIMEIFAAFIRENAPIIEEEIEDEDELEEELSEELLKIPTDIQAALTVIGRRNAELDPKDLRLDLRYTDISGADLTEANFSKADLSGANLSDVMLYTANLMEADLSGSDLEGAILFEANLQSCIFYEANLQKCVLRKANLSNAILYQANLQGAIIYDANLTEAILTEADLQGANLSDTNLQSANFEGSNLTGANLIGANLQEANLMGANLEGASLSTANLSETIVYEAVLVKANLSEANLCGANLTGANLQEAILEEANFCGADLTRVENLQAEQIESAYGDSTTCLPKNLARPARWVK
jgi:uncharacterized protein YjbI with pentapeptide repeats